MEVQGLSYPPNAQIINEVQVSDVAIAGVSCETEAEEGVMVYVGDVAGLLQTVSQRGELNSHSSTNIILKG